MNKANKVNEISKKYNVDQNVLYAVLELIDDKKKDEVTQLAEQLDRDLKAIGFYK